MRSRYGLIALVAGLAVLLDQATKSWAVGRLSPEGSPGIEVVGSLRLKLAFNSGMAFSQGQGRGALIGLVAIGIVAVMVWIARSVEDLPGRIAVGLVIGGALGNLMDRVFRAGPPGVPRGFLDGRVVDFVYLGWWPTFNVADACVVCGAILLAISTLRTSE